MSKKNVFWTWYSEKARKITYLCGREISSDSRDHITISYGLWSLAALLETILPNHQIQAKFLNNLRSDQFNLATFLSRLDEGRDYFTTVASEFQPFKGVDYKFLLVDTSDGCVSAQLRCVVEVLASLSSREAWKGYQVLSYLRKLDIDRDDVKQSLVDDYLAAEATDPSIDHGLLKRAAELLAPHLAFAMEPFVPKHGPGAVAEVGIITQVEKYSHMRHDARIEYLLNKYGYSMQDFSPLPMMDEQSTRTCRYIHVPKTWKTLRGISAEPVELQYWQQAVRHSIQRGIAADPWYASRVDLSNQSRSRRMAYYGQISGRFATIDLHAASDSVRVEHVRALFSSNIELLQWLLATRSTFVKVGDSTIRTKKFAPMGSATCFVVETLLFLAIAELAIADSGAEGSATVYGDDCIVPSEAASRFQEYLERLGFIVNHDKSFSSGLFREACGWDVYNGFVITPVKYRRLRAAALKKRLTPAGVAHLIAIADAFQRRGLHYASRTIIRDINTGTVTLGRKTVEGSQLLLFSGEYRVGLGPGDVDLPGEYLYSSCPTNFHLPMRLNESLWRIECRHITVKSRYVGPDLPDEGLYLRWLIEHQQEAGRIPAPADFSSTVREASIYLSSTWTEVE